MFRGTGQRPATKSDLSHVNEIAAVDALPGSCWVFERTIAAKAHNAKVDEWGLTQRVLQLFALVSEDGTIMKVSRDREAAG